MKKHLHSACIAWVVFLLAAFSGSYAKIPGSPLPSAFTPSITFTENKGQVLNEQGKPRTDILFTGKGKGVQFYLTKKGITYTWHKNQSGKRTLQQVHMELTGTNPAAEIIADQPEEAVENYFHSAYPQGISQVKSYRKIVYREVYPHIDFVIYTHGEDLKYDFVVRPGGKIENIRFTYKGIQALRLQKDGSLLIINRMGKLTEGTPFTYQSLKGDTTEVQSAYHLQQGVISFQTGTYDPAQTLIIDPAVSWVNAFGGNEDDLAIAVATDLNGNVFITGRTNSATNTGMVLNAPSGSKQTFSEAASGEDAFIAKYNSEGVRLWSTYYGGNSSDRARGIVVDKAGHVYISGETSSNTLGFGPSAVHQTTYGGGRDAFLAKFDNNGQLIWHTYYGGDKEDMGLAVALDSNDNVYLSGQTRSENSNGSGSNTKNNVIAFNGFKSYHGIAGTQGEFDAFLVKFTSSGQRLWGTYYGGASRDLATHIVTDANHVYISGYTASTNSSVPVENIYQVTPGNTAHQTVNNSNFDAFLAKFDHSGNIVWGTYLGGTQIDQNDVMVVDNEGNLYICGSTRSPQNIATTGTHQPALSGNGSFRDGFIVKFNSTGERVWGTYLGGESDDFIHGGQLDNDGNLLVAGVTYSLTGIFQDGYQNSLKGDNDIFISKINPVNGQRLWSTYYGADGKDWCNDMARDAEGNFYLTGNTTSTSGFVTNVNNYTHSGKEDIFLLRIDDILPAVTTLSPAENSTEVNLSAPLQVTFNEAVIKGTGNITIRQGDQTPVVIPVSSPDIIIEGNKVTISSGRFASGASIRITIDGACFKDLAGNLYKGINDWEFTTIIDVTPPKIISLTPAHQAVKVAHHTDLSIEFDEEIAAGTGIITIYENGVPTSIASNSTLVNITGNKVSISLPDFDYNSNISVQIEGTAFKDPDDNFFTGLSAGTWKFTIEADEIAPQVLSLTPAHDTDSIDVNTRVEILFNEAVFLSPGTITIRQNNIAIPYEEPKVDGNKVSIELPDFLLGAQISIEISNTAIRDAAGNYFAGIPAGSWQFTVWPVIKISPEIFEPVSVSHTDSEIDPTSIPTLSIELSPNPSGIEVAFYVRGISDAGTDWKKHPVIPSENTYGLAAPIESIDKIGLEYYFEVTPPPGYGAAFRSDTGIVYINYVHGLNIPMQPGSKQNQYKLISVPLNLEDSRVSQVFNYLGEPDVERWRLFQYNNDGNTAGYEEYKNISNGFTSIETGKAYWILARKGADFLSGSGSTVKVQQTEPYTINLQAGWNLIGNPYDIDVSWKDVQLANLDVVPDTLALLYPYDEKGYSPEGGNLMRFQGGFVWADAAVNIKIPVLLNKDLNARLSAEKPLHHAGSAFEVNFTLQSKDMRYRLAGLGMHPSASSGKDRYDRYLLPRFNDYLDIRFASDTTKTPGFTKQMVPVADEYNWEFTIETSQQPQLMALTWENYFAEPDGRQLYLYDVVQETIINMLDQQKYTFHSGTSTLFKVYYGSPLYISKHLRPQRIKLNQNIPNPFRGETLIPFSLPDGRSEYTVAVTIYNTAGNEVAELGSGKYQPGFHQLTWSGKDAKGNPLPAGLYIARLVVAEEKQNREMFIRIVIQ